MYPEIKDTYYKDVVSRYKQGFEKIDMIIRSIPRDAWSQRCVEILDILSDLPHLSIHTHIVDGVDIRSCGNACYDCDSDGKPTERVQCSRRYKDRIYYCDEFSDCDYKQKVRLKEELEKYKMCAIKIRNQLSPFVSYVNNGYRLAKEQLPELTNLVEKVNNYLEEVGE